MFEGFRKRLGGIFSSKNREEVFKKSELGGRVLEALIESDVSVAVAERISDISEKFVEKSGGKITESQMISIIRKSVKSVLDSVEAPVDILKPPKKPYVIMFLGVNGGGKTTTIAKLAALLRSKGSRVVLSASDTFRAGAIEQIAHWSNEVGVELIRHDKGSDPSSVAYDAITHAVARKMDYVLIDTAGRMQNNKNLVEEMKKIKRVAKPDLTLLILDAMIGQDALLQGKTFMDDIGFDGIVITKLDTDAKGGLLISLCYELKKPVYFIGIGQRVEDIMGFDSNWYLDRLFPESFN
ncbi:MAG: signal recognition particle-docking protein FtsY [Thermoplasmataceae archaeon]|jgi:fused signal recognition particle receptor|nr:signal recognition particle-docking protein FtsY [Candidatus Thermoplasmatota archaeon]